MVDDTKWILVTRRYASKFVLARRPSRSSWRQILKPTQKNGDVLRWSTSPATCSARLPVGWRDAQQQSIVDAGASLFEQLPHAPHRAAVWCNIYFAKHTSDSVNAPAMCVYHETRLRRGSPTVPNGCKPTPISVGARARWQQLSHAVPALFVPRRGTHQDRPCPSAPDWPLAWSVVKAESSDPQPLHCSGPTAIVGHRRGGAANQKC
jgi:hypothetical protein